MTTLDLAIELIEGLKSEIPHEKYEILRGYLEAANKTVKIYKITCNLTEKVYIGHTTMSLAQRVALHKSSHIRTVAGKINDMTSSSEIMKNDDYRIELIEMCSATEKLDREKHHIQSTDCVNKLVPNPFTCAD